MVVGRGDVDRAGLGAVSLLREDDRYLSPAPQHVRDDRLVAGVKMLDHYHRDREPVRQAAEHAPESDDAARRRSNGHDAVRFAWLGSGGFRIAHRSEMPSRYAYTQQA